MKTVIENNCLSLRKLLIEYGIKNIIEVKHDHDFIFKATTPESYITIHTEPYDEEQLLLHVNSIVITLEEKVQLTPEEQNIYLYIASYGNNRTRMMEYLNSEKCSRTYPTKDIVSFRNMFESKDKKNILDSYWNLDTTSRDCLIEIISKVFSIKL